MNWLRGSLWRRPGLRDQALLEYSRGTRSSNSSCTLQSISSGKTACRSLKTFFFYKKSPSKKVCRHEWQEHVMQPTCKEFFFSCRGQQCENVHQRFLSCGTRNGDGQLVHRCPSVWEWDTYIHTHARMVFDSLYMEIHAAWSML